MKLQPNSQVIASAIWNAIGSLLPAAQGVAAAKRDHGLPGRTIIFEGDGSLQVTCQAISDIIRYRLDVTIIIANNAGYTYERWLNGMDAEYNDVPSWRYIEAASFFGADLDDPSYPIYSKRVETWGELLAVLEDERAGDGKGLKIVDIAMDPKDVPEASKPGLLRAADALKSA
jgi:pyruvate decarboxylase